MLICFFIASYWDSFPVFFTVINKAVVTFTSRFLLAYLFSLKNRVARPKRVKWGGGMDWEIWDWDTFIILIPSIKADNEWELLCSSGNPTSTLGFEWKGSSKTRGFYLYVYG